MALGNDNQSNGKLLILKPKTQDAEKHKIDPVFQISEKNQETGKWGVTGSVASVSGDLSKIEVKEQEYLGEKYETLSVYLTDSVLNETYLLDFRLNMLTRSIINALLSLEKFNEVKIGLYTSKKDYPAASVRQHGELVNWKYSLDEIPQPEEVKFKGKVQRDYTAPDNFFIEKVKELAAKLGAAPAPKKSAPEKASPAKNKAQPKELIDDVDDGDLADDENEVF